jgi:hypothetical protein
MVTPDVPPLLNEAVQVNSYGFWILQNKVRKD